MPGIDTAAPERTETSNGRGPLPNVPPLAASNQAMPAASSSPKVAGKLPVSRNAVQARVVMTNAGGTGRPRLRMRAMDQALPPIS